MVRLMYGCGLSPSAIDVNMSTGCFPAAHIQLFDWQITLQRVYLYEHNMVCATLQGLLSLTTVHFSFHASIQGLNLWEDLGYFW